MPEYLEAAEVEALIEYAPNVPCKLLMLIQWHAGLRISEALGLEARDVQLKTEHPPSESQARQGPQGVKGGVIMDRRGGCERPGVALQNWTTRRLL